MNVPIGHSDCARGFSEALQADVAPYGIDVTTIYPFFTRTPMLESEQFGLRQRSVPQRLLYDPERIVSALMGGIRKRKRHIYPGAIPRRLDLIQRLAPWVIPLFHRLMR